MDEALPSGVVMYLLCQVGIQMRQYQDGHCEFVLPEKKENQL